MSSLGFSALLRSVSRSEVGQLSAVIDAGWGQGRTTFGGIGAALGFQAATGLVHQAMPLRSLQVNFVGPIAPGDVKLTSEVLRAGRSVAVASARIHQNDECCLNLVATFGAARSEPVSVAPADHLRVDIPDRESLRTVEPPPMAPKFLNHFEIRFAEGAPFGKPTQGRHVRVWMRHKDPQAAEHPAGRLIALADTPPPVVFLHYPIGAMASSVSWSLEFVVPPEDVKSEWFYLDYTLEAAADGYSQQSGVIYDEDGRVIALSRQCMTYYGPKQAQPTQPAA